MVGSNLQQNLSRNHSNFSWCNGFHVFNYKTGTENQLIMLRRIAVYFCAFLLLFFLAKYIHSEVLESLKIQPIFSLPNVYIFHAVFSFCVCAFFSFLAEKNKWFDQLGLIYLVALVIKIALFFIVFYKSIFSIGEIPKSDSISLLIPIAIFVTAEVYFVARILNTK